MSTRLLTRTNINSISKSIYTRQTFIWDPSLVLYAPLWDETNGSSFTSKDANAHVCTATGTTWGSQGRVFDGDDNIDFGNPAVLDISTALTVIAWVKATALNPIFNMIQAKGVAEDNSGWVLYASGATGELATYIYSGSWLNLTAIAQLSLNTWYQVGLTHQSGATKLWINGQIVATSAAIGNITAGGTFSYRLGNQISYEITRYWTGLIGEVLTYNRVFSQVGIQHNYLATKWRYS